MNRCENESLNQQIKHEPVDCIKLEYQDSENQSHSFSQLSTEDGFKSLVETSFDHSTLDYSLDESTQPSAPKRKGRPRGAKNGTGRGIIRSIPTETKALPKMKPNVHQIKLSLEQIDRLKKVESFGQPGVCFQIAPKLDNCNECKKFTSNKRKEKKNIECRFYQFRKLRYNGDELEVAGFLDPTKDPVEVDRNIWSPIYEKNNRFKTLSIPDARLILTHVGEQFCQLIQEEKKYFKKYNTEGKPNIWKRLIE